MTFLRRTPGRRLPGRTVLSPRMLVCAIALLGSIAHAQTQTDGQANALPAVPKLDANRALTVSQNAIGRLVGDYTLRDVDGRAFELASLRGKPVVVSFVYTGCFQVCPTTTRTLKRAVESAMTIFGTDRFNVVTVGFNQPFDTPAAMRAYANAQGVHLPNWHFLSPDAGVVSALAADLGFSYAPSSGGFDHLTQVSVLDARGRVYRQVYGDGFSPPQLIDPLKELLTNAPTAAPSVGSLMDRVRLLCTYYDPTTGRYRYNYSILIEIAGGLTGLIAFGMFMWRHRRAW